MKGITESENYFEKWHCGIHNSGQLALIKIKYDTRCPSKKIISIRNCVDWPLKLCELSLSASDVPNHISNTPVPALFLAYRAITQLEKTLSREQGGLILSLMQPQQQQDITLTR